MRALVSASSLISFARDSLLPLLTISRGPLCEMFSSLTRPGCLNGSTNSTVSLSVRALYCRSRASSSTYSGSLPEKNACSATGSLSPLSTPTVWSERVKIRSLGGPQFLRLIGSAPPVRLDGAVGREQPEDDDREEVDDVLQLEGPLAEGVEMADGSEIGDEVAYPSLRFGCRPADDPGHQEDDEGDQRRHHLRLRQRGDEKADGHVRRAHQEQPQVAEEHRSPLDAVGVLRHQLHQQRI